MSPNPGNHKKGATTRLAIIRACGLVVASLGALALIGWTTGYVGLASFNAAYIPMAPLTAVLFILHGGLLLAYGHVPNKLSITVLSLVTIISFAVFILRLIPVYLDIEYLALTEQGTLGAMPLGLMSSITALCFILAGIANSSVFLGRFSPVLRKTILFGAAIAMLAIAFVFFLGYIYGQPILYDGEKVPPAITTILSFGVLGAGLLLTIRSTFESEHPEEIRAFSYPLATIFIFLVLGIVSVGGMYFRNYEEQYRREIEKSLQAISNLKVNHITYWRNERKADGEILHRNSTLKQLVADYIKSGEQKRTNHSLRDWLKTYYAYGEIRAALIDAEGNTILSQFSNESPVSMQVAGHAREVLDGDSVVIHDFYTDEHDGHVYLAVLVPIILNQDLQKPLAVLVLRVDPQYFLFPFIQQWPTESTTGETLIVRRDGNDVLFLNQLRFLDDTSMKLRIPVSDKDLPAARAVNGGSGIVEGHDYRDVEVFAYIQKVKDSPWYLVARIDKDEVFAELRERLFMLAGLVLFLVLSAGSWLTMSARRQRLQFYKTSYEAAEALRESEFRLRQAESVGHLGHWRYDIGTSSLTWSDEMYKIHGVERSEFKPSPNRVLLLIHPEDRETYRASISNIQENGEDIFEYRIPLKDGSIRYVMVKGLVSVDQSGESDIIYGITLDTTEIKLQERKLEEINSELARFTYTVSHDLKSPLVTVKTFLGYLEEDSKNKNTERVASDMKYIHSAIDKMSQLLDELLEMSRVGRITNPPELVTCNEIIDEALAMVAGHISKDNIEIKRDCQSVTLFADRPRLVEVWQNLIENAVKYKGDAENPTIEIGNTIDADSVIFFVRDNGIGIDPKYKEKVFGLFEKLNNQSDGTGLGLALVQRIVTLHEGKIWLESDGPGTGTTFYFTLPSAIYNKEGHAQ